MDNIYVVIQHIIIYISTPTTYTPTTPTRESIPTTKGATTGPTKPPRSTSVAETTTR